MPVLSLQKICIEKTCGFLEEEVWENCEENPFSFMPPSVVQDLWSHMLSTRSELDVDWIVHSQQLLTSGRLQHVDLKKSRRLREPYQGQLFQMLSHSCQQLRTLSLPRCCPPVRNLPELLQNCTKLEELCSPFSFDPCHLRNCKKLRSLKLYLDYAAGMEFLSRLSPARLQHLASLEVFAFPLRILPKTEGDKYGLMSVAANILDICPKLSSLGHLDSLMAMSIIYRRVGRTRQHFNIKRCYWRATTDITPKVYCDAIRVAANSCPLLEVLDVRVRYADSLNHLKVLINLTELVLNFYDCVDEYEHEFCALLNEIGHQLHTLFISGLRYKIRREPFNFNWEWEDNSNEGRLQLLGEESSKESSVKLLGLRRLAVFECSREIQFFLLSNSIHLKMLRLKNCLGLDDYLLNEILQKNSFSELESADAFECSLSKIGLERFVRSALKLRSMSSVSSPLIDGHEVEQCLRQVNPSLSIRREYKPTWFIKMH